MGRVIHFELFSQDAGRQVEFYRSVFGWQVEPWQGPFEYHLVTTGPDVEAGINGAIAPFGELGEQPIALTVAVDDLDAAISRATASGAEAITERREVPGVGWMAYLRDPSGTAFAMLQPSPEAPQAQPGGDVWADFGDSLRQLGDTVSRAFSEAAASPQAQRAREEAGRAARGIRDASAAAADKARPHVITALDRVSVELGNLASRLRREEPLAEEAPEEPGAPVTSETGEAPPDEY